MNEDFITNKSIVTLVVGAIIFGCILLENGSFDSIGDVSMRVAGALMLIVGICIGLKLVRSL